MSYLKKFNEASMESFSGQNEAEDKARELLAEADEKIAKFRKFFHDIDYREPDSVGYSLRDTNTTYEDFE